MNKAKASKNWINKDTNNLFQAILQLKNLTETRNFFRDLLTEKELLEFAQRWKVAKLLAEGKPYIDIEKETDMSSTTIARISHWLKDGLGGYKLMINRIKK